MLCKEEVVIKVENISKIYQVYNDPKQRLLQFFNRNIKYYKEFRALDSVSFEVKRGSTMGILGKNGSGKSTLLQMVAGTLTPTHGEIEINGRVVALLELGSGFNQDFTGRENIYLNGAMFGITKGEMDLKYKEIERFADIGEYIEQPVKTYSSGMFARLAFSVAINMNPDILIVDEILAVGDMAFQAKCVSKLRKMKDNGLTLLFVSHSIDAMKSLCNSAILLEKGKMVDIGTSESITNKYLASIRKDMNDEVSINIKSSDAEQFEKAQDEDTKEWLEEFRYGNGQVFLKDITLINDFGKEAKAFNFSENITLRCKILSKGYYENINISFLVRDITGIDLFGTTMFDEKVPLFTLEKGEEKIVCFRFQANLRAGSYSISVAVNSVTNKDYSDVYLHQQIDAASAFEVIRDLDRPVHYKFSLPVNVYLER